MVYSKGLLAIHFSGTLLTCQYSVFVLDLIKKVCVGAQFSSAGRAGTLCIGSVVRIPAWVSFIACHLLYGLWDLFSLMFHIFTLFVLSPFTPMYRVHVCAWDDYE